MSFDEYFQKVELKVNATYSLEALIVRRKRISIGNIAGLSYKVKHGRLVAHSYTAFRDDHYIRGKNDNINDT
ncbi:hypothetical protein BTN60_21095 [Vibrio parahaemolyticus]|uniref:Uncharacterized protein n=1 Tax=Vibrio parahaemolyticus TaxID=670 RepID=A0AAX1G0Y5_VIBPH|nr:hypothetical protein BTN34_22335 [Vibrio parahaemolyticus]OUD68359.1 hypothetical protein BTN60_21095 [Vibrio parahaemolyticus]QHH13250.1 hypothetical protein EHC69_28755 [Vibrio parahaemolyticus]TNY98723.1 hypothetical protein CGK56_20455 [Vibrio parahaemolyticus]